MGRLYADVSDGITTRRYQGIEADGVIECRGLVPDRDYFAIAYFDWTTGDVIESEKYEFRTLKEGNAIVEEPIAIEQAGEGQYDIGAYFESTYPIQYATCHVSEDKGMEDEMVFPMDVKGTTEGELLCRADCGYEKKPYVLLELRDIYGETFKFGVFEP